MALEFRNFLSGSDKRSCQGFNTQFTVASVSISPSHGLKTARNSDNHVRVNNFDKSQAMSDDIK
jgi:hypothetical protein